MASSEAVADKSFRWSTVSDEDDFFAGGPKTSKQSLGQRAQHASLASRLEAAPVRGRRGKKKVAKKKKKKKS